jgi:hypothetical protein
MNNRKHKIIKKIIKTMRLRCKNYFARKFIATGGIRAA